MTGVVLKHSARLVRFIELRQVGPGDRFQGIWVGDVWTPPFHTTVSQRKLVLDTIRKLDECRGLPIVTREGCFLEMAA